MLVSSREFPRSVMVGGEDGVHRPRKAWALEAAGANVKFGFEADTEVSFPQMEMLLERIRLAAGETS